MVLTVHHLGHSQSDRVVFLCEELGIPYELKKYDRSPLLAPPELKKLHPIEASPVIEDDGGVVLAETEACFEYIAHVHGGGKFFVKPGEKNYADFLYYYHVANGTLQPAIGRIMALNFAGIKRDSGNPLFERFDAKIQQVYGMLNKRVKEVPWLAGEEFTAADMMMIWSLTGMREFVPSDLSAYPDLLKYMKKVVDRPAYRKYLEKGDPDIAEYVEKSISAEGPPKFKGIKRENRL
ncbi:hypothetical protein CKM354_000606700 [Cercospora kikuchii]|uniref:Glutathione S-transferase n=1 Tax=Cercospora kikuchii TaxID=84275 RepID=A0A9P3FD15_9PEZI|nr:uncharacterized protein CKM354_000606700 [Cercospora kikuchii]GIZ42813.1 hypothetical protein CKM354_000606700 [Cercospora kikuchii]